jgi:hypothetical protein
MRVFKLWCILNLMATVRLNDSKKLDIFMFVSYIFVSVFQNYKKYYDATSNKNAKNLIWKPLNRWFIRRILRKMCSVCEQFTGVVYNNH